MPPLMTLEKGHSIKMRNKLKHEVVLDIPSSASSTIYNGQMSLKFPESAASRISISRTTNIEILDSKVIITIDPSSSINIEAKEKEKIPSFYSYQHSSSSKVIPDDIVTILDTFPNDDIEDEMLESDSQIKKPEKPKEVPNPFETAIKCNIDCIRVVHDLSTISLDAFYNFFEIHGHFSREKVCPNCGDPMSIRYGRFECRKQNSAKSKKRHIICFSQTAFKDSWFDGGINKAKKIILICFLYVSGVPSHQVKQQVKTQHTTQWYEACQSVVIDFFKRKSQRIGGSGTTVEMIVTKIPQGNSNKLWVIGGIEIKSKRSFMVTVSNLTKKFLLQIMSSWINRGTLILSESLQLHIDSQEHGFVLEPENKSNSSDMMEFDSSDCESQHSFFAEERLLASEKMIFNLFEKKLPNIEERFHEFIIAAGVSYAKG